MVGCGGNSDFPETDSGSDPDNSLGSNCVKGGTFRGNINALDKTPIYGNVESYFCEVELTLMTPDRFVLSFSFDNYYPDWAYGNCYFRETHILTGKAYCDGTLIPNEEDTALYFDGEEIGGDFEDFRYEYHFNAARGSSSGCQ